MNTDMAELIRKGTLPTDDEISAIRMLASDAGFEESSTTRVGRRAAGLVWNGQLLTGNELLTSAEAHYLRHVIAGQEWPYHTSLSTYLESLRVAVLDPAGGIFLDEVFGTLRLTFFAPSRAQRGPNGGDWILVGYGVDYGHWTTGFQLASSLEHFFMEAPNRQVQRWLRKPT